MPDISIPSVEERVAARADLSELVQKTSARGDFKAALQIATQAAERYEAAQDAEGQALTHYLIGACYRRLNDLPASLQNHQESHERYEALNDTVGSATALRAKASTLMVLGRTEEAIHDLKQCCAMFQQAGERAEEMRTRMNLSIHYKRIGDIAASQSLLFDCLAFFEESGDTRDLSKTLLNIASNYNLLGNPEDAVRFAERGILLLEALDDRQYISMARAVLGSAFLNQKNYKAALEQYNLALPLAEQMEIRSTIAIILGEMSSAFLHLKRFEEAREALERSLGINGADENRLAYCDNLILTGRLYAHPDYAGRDPQRALACLQEALRIAEEEDTSTLLVDIHETLADLHEQNGEYQQALASFRAFHAVDKRLFNEESDKRIQRLELEKAQKDAEIAHLRMVELAQALEEAERLRALADERARTDVLTSLLNRRALDECLEDEFERARHNGRPLAVALADLDRFKDINDKQGHGIGDETLRHTALLLRSLCRGEDRVARYEGEYGERRQQDYASEGRAGDHVARYGGEEFALLLPNTTLSAALALCERLREAMAMYDWTTVHPDLGRVTISIGVSAVEVGDSKRYTAPSALLAEADQNLYRAKRGGRNRVVG